MFNRFIIEPFFEVASKNNKRNAFCISEKFYTYQQFIQQISNIRILIKSLKLKTKNIGLVVNDDIETYASIFAIWIEGYAYVPLHPSFPIDRVLEIIQQADIESVLNSKEDSSFLYDGFVCSSNLINSSIDMTFSYVSEDHLAYILFTSGSTGKPKGVPITRKSIGAFMQSFWETGIFIDENDKCLQAFDLTFDVSIQSFLVPLTKGACVYTIPHNQIKYSYVYGLLDEHKLTFGAMAPSMIRFLKPYFDEIKLLSMRYNILTAEASPIDLINEWSNCIPNAEIFDFYGPTEATIYCTYYKVDLQNMKHLNGMLSIGKPMFGISAIIIDENGCVVPNGKAGELCVAGNQVTNGYWKNKEKTRDVFLEMEYEGKKLKFYKTGDACYYDKDGDIMYSGRLDYQVKIQGYRIELGEIEFHARECLDGTNAIAITDVGLDGNNEIVLYIESESVDCYNLKKYLKQKLPNYMIPVKIYQIAKFPLNINGKVDRNILKKIKK